MDRGALKGIYAKLKGLERSVPHSGIMRSTPVRDYNILVKQLAAVIDEDTAYFVCGPEVFYNENEYCHLDVFRAKLGQLTSYLDEVYQISTNIIEIGSLYNSIADPELKERCADLLSAPSNFDRVINQATQVLEDRIRKKAGADRSLASTQLVNEVLKGELAKTKLKVSDDEGEQRGISDICRGIMFAFRNPTHHQLTDRFSREDALKLCAFVDNLLTIVDRAEVCK